MNYDLSKEHDKLDFQTKVNYFLAKGEKVGLSKVQKKRSLSINSYLHVCITLYAIEYGCSIEEMKQTLKHWKGWYKTNKAGAVVYAKTSKMDNKQLSEFIEWIRTHAAKNIGLNIPSPELYLQEQFYVNKLIASNEAHL